MLSIEVAEILNKQTAVEADASHAYLALASWSEERNLPGIAEYFYAASEDERSHFLEIIKYINLPVSGHYPCGYPPKVFFYKSFRGVSIRLGFGA